MNTQNMIFLGETLIETHMEKHSYNATGTYTVHHSRAFHCVATRWRRTAELFIFFSISAPFFILHDTNLAPNLDVDESLTFGGEGGSSLCDIMVFAVLDRITVINEAVTLHAGGGRGKKTVTPPLPDSKS